MTELADFMPTRMPEPVTFPRDGSPVPITVVVDWFRTGCPNVHEQYAAILEARFESVSLLPFPDGSAMAVIGKTNQHNGAYRITCSVMTPHENPELAVLAELTRVFHRTTGYLRGDFKTKP